jgi:hypothetical protein
MEYLSSTAIFERYQQKEQTTMKAAAIIHIITLPAIMAKLTLQIVSQQSGGVKVQGPGETGGNVLFQDASQFGKAGTTASCLDANSRWTTVCPDQPTYLKVAELNFAKATEGRAFHVITPFEHLSVSKLTKHGNETLTP